MFGDAKAIINRSLAACCVKTCRTANGFGVNACNQSQDFGRIPPFTDEFGPAGKLRLINAFGDEGFVFEAFGDDGVGDGIDNGDVGARHQRQVELCLDVG